ncbi:right-handed parallel beta-helix repeat-containing protein [Methanobrevibacter sp. DSM 116169]|uniref:right-handed parallel beta-helix repeat-containing protein n=1 Tax=Methanobrevibacter sp. DSM 116169 TaxID=3242727 RepID=UPI0038FD22DC
MTTNTTYQKTKRRTNNTPKIIQNLEPYSNNYNGIHSDGNPFITNIIIDANTIFNNKHYGISINGGGTSLSITNNELFSNIRSIFLKTASNSIIDNNTCKDQVDAGIEVQNSLNLTIINNVINTTTRNQAMLIYNSNKINILKNNISNTLGTVTVTASEPCFAIIVQNSDNLIIKDNRIENSTSKQSSAWSGGIYITSTKSIVNYTISNNLIDGLYRSSSFAIVAYVNGAYTFTNITINDNDISNYYYGIRLYGYGSYKFNNSNVYGNNVSNVRQGFYLQYSYNFNVSDNNISGLEYASSYGIINFNSDNFYISNNEVSDFERAIAVQSTNSVTDNNFVYNNVYGIYSPGVNGIIENNAIFNNSYGLYLPSSNGNISNNDVYGNSYGIYVTGLNNTITNNTLFNNTRAFHIAGDDNVIVGSNIYNNTEGIYLNRDAIVNYNRIFSNTNALILGPSSTSNDLNYNWWGSNNISDILAIAEINSYFVANATALVNNVFVGGNWSINYTFYLNGTKDNTGVEKLPDFNADLVDSLNNLYNSQIAKNTDVMNVKTNESVIDNFFIVVDNEIIPLGIFQANKILDYNLNVSTIVNGSNVTVSVVTESDINGFVNLTIGNDNYTIELINGSGSLTITDLDDGNYTANVTYLGNNKYGPMSNSSNFTIFSNYIVLTGNNITLVYLDGTRYVVYLLDAYGNPIIGVNVTITINGVSYNRTTNSSGAASLAINLRPNNYTAETVYGNLTVNNSVFVSPTIIAEDLEKFYRNGTEFEAVFIYANGSALANKNVTFNINGVFYNRTTNSDGNVTLNINLDPGVYIITAINFNDGLNMSYIIKVYANLFADNLTKYYRNGSQYHITVWGNTGELLVGANVTININGVFYNRTTNASGIATLNINLDPGNYIATVTHPNGLNISNIIIVKSILNTTDITMTSSNRTTYDILVLNDVGDPVPDVNVTININGVFYNRTTNASGVAILNINLDPGHYIATVYYEDYETSNNIIVKP